MKKYKMIKFCTIPLLIVCLALCSCDFFSNTEKTSVGVIGGADGPTAIFVATPENTENVNPDSEKISPDSEIQEEFAQMINPHVSYQNADFLDKAGFCVNYLPLDFCGAKLVGTSLVNDKIAQFDVEITAENGAVDTLRLRVAKSSQDDISGVYDSFDSISTLTACGISDTVISSGKDVILAEWSYDGFDFSLFTRMTDKQLFAEILDKFMLYTHVSDTQFAPVLATVYTNMNPDFAPIPTADFVFGGDMDFTGQDFSEFQSFVVSKMSSSVEILSVNFDDDGSPSFEMLETLTTDKDNFCVKIVGMIPEGLPKYALRITSGENSALCFVTYDGRGEKPTFAVYPQ